MFCWVGQYYPTLWICKLNASFLHAPSFLFHSHGSPWCLVVWFVCLFACFLKRKGRNLSRWEDLRGVRGGKTMIRSYWMKNIFNKICIFKNICLCIREVKKHKRIEASPYSTLYSIFLGNSLLYACPHSKLLPGKWSLEVSFLRQESLQ